MSTKRSQRISPYSVVYQYVALDMLALLGSGVALTYLMDRVPLESYGSNFGLTFTAAVVFFLLGANTGLYNATKIFDRDFVFRRALVTIVATFVALLVAAFALKHSEDYSRGWFFTWAAVAISLVVATRLALGALHARSIRRGAFFQRAVVLSTPLAAADVRAPPAGTLALASLPLDSVDQIDERIAAAQSLGVDVINIRCGWDEFPQLVERATAYKSRAVDVSVELVTPAAPNGLVAVRTEDGRLLVELARRPIRGWNAEVKRFEDIVVATLALLVLWPVMLATAMAIKVESRGPVIFRQRRLGFNNAPFEVWKFRSMYLETLDHDAERQTSPGDERVTRVGRFIRRTSLDELPQLFNVLQGHMSIVGPRPHALKTSAAGKNFQDIVDSYAARHRVLPGMTGWAQVNGLRGAVESVEKIERRVKYDLFYIDNWSIWLDLRTMLMTLRVLADNRKTY